MIPARLPQYQFQSRCKIGSCYVSNLSSNFLFIHVFGTETPQVFWNAKSDHITIEIPLLIDAAFCAGSGMIAFGAVIGKTTPTQLLWLMFAQVGQGRGVNGGAVP